MPRSLIAAMTAAALALSAVPAAARGGAGSLVAATPLAGAPAGTASRIRYRSVDADGRAVTVTGFVVVPHGRAPAGGRDVVVWAHGTTGVAEACAPSDAAYRYSQVAGLGALLAAGYVVVAPDYQGLGNPGPHPYLVGEATGDVVLDAVKAVHAMPKAETSTRFAVWGESQGGHAGLWAGKLARRYAPGFDLVGVAAAAPVTDLKANLTGGKDPAIRAFLTAFAGTSWARVYHLPLTTVVKPHTAQLMTAIARNCVSAKGFKLRTKIGLARLMNQMKGVDLAANPRWAALMTRNSVTPVGLHAPVLVIQGSKDVIVAPALTRAFVGKLCRHGVAVTSVSDDGDHITAGKRGAAIAVSWLGDRFEGKEPPSDCPSR